jgi:hypothetical protein
MIAVSVVLDRDVFLVFGTIGIIEFLGRLSYKYFKGYFLFPFSLTLIGFALITCGIYYQKHRKGINKFVGEKIPRFVLKARPRRVRG